MTKKKFNALASITLQNESGRYRSNRNTEKFLTSSLRTFHDRNWGQSTKIWSIQITLSFNHEG